MVNRNALTCMLVLFVAAVVVVPAAAQTERRVPQSSSEISLSFAPLVREVGPAVVNVYSRATVSERPGLSPLFDDPFFKRFFGDIGPRLRSAAGTRVLSARGSSSIRAGSS